MSDPITNSPFANASDLQLKQIISDAERVLSTQLSVGIAADQRAMVFSGFIAAAVVALIGGAAAILIGPDHHFIGYLALATGIGLLISMGYAVFSARPTSFEWAGNDPASWHQDIAASKPFTTSMQEQCEHYQSMIVSNRATLSKNNQLLLRAQYITLIVLLCAGLSFIAYFILVSALASCASAGKLTLVAAVS